MENEFLLRNSEYLEAIVRERKEKEKDIVGKLIEGIENGAVGVGVIDNGYKLYCCDCIGSEYNVEIVKVKLPGLSEYFAGSINGMSIVDETLRVCLWVACRKKVAENEKADK